MPRFSTSLTEDQDQWLEDEADRRDRSKADIVRWCIDMVRTGEVNTEPENTEAVGTDVVQRGELETVADRLDELEDRVDQLEESDTVLEYNETATETAQSDVVEWVRQNQPVSRKDIVRAFEDEIEARHIKPDSWWRRHGRPELEQAGAEYTRNVGWMIE